MAPHLDQALPFAWFGLATATFHLAVQRPAGPPRHALAALHVLATICALNQFRLTILPFHGAWVHACITISLHTFSLLVLESCRIDTVHLSSANQRLSAAFQIWGDIRRLPTPLRLSSPSDTRRPAVSPLTKWTAACCLQVVVLCCAHHAFKQAGTHLARALQVSLWDYAPDKQGLWPPWASTRDLCWRAWGSLAWIPETYLVLTTAHAVLAVAFVSVLGWSAPDEWPSLFGSIIEARSLRRFWGVFWHRLSTRVALIYLDHFLFLVSRASGSGFGPAKFPPAVPKKVQNALRACWVFFFSALCHAAVNFITTHRANAAQEARFFLANCLVCLIETLLSGRRAASRDPTRSQHHTTAKNTEWGYSQYAVGYVWVLAVFFMLAPAWQWSPISLALGFTPT